MLKALEREKARVDKLRKAIRARDELINAWWTQASELYDRLEQLNPQHKDELAQLDVWFRALIKRTEDVRGETIG